MIICKQCNNQFDIHSEDYVFYEKMGVPTPLFCIDCRRQRLFIWRNQRNLYSRACSATGKQIISVFSPDSPYTVYDRDYWWSDAWDPLDYGMEFDFSKTFAEQFDALLHRTPLVGIFNGKSENSQYCNHVGEMKDCYLAFASWQDQDVMYADLSWDDDACLDILETNTNKGCYGLVQSSNCFNTKYSIQSVRCNDSWFLYDCKDCSNCIGCTNLRNKEHCIFNKQYSLAEFQTKKEELRLATRTGISQTQKIFNELKKQALHRYAQMINCEGSTGDYLISAKNCHYCFALRDNLANNAYCINGGKNMIDVYDGYGVGAGYERGYLSVDSGVGANDYIFGIVMWGCQYAYYNYNCHSSYEIIGCTGIRNKKYCILNKQYSQSEYEELKKRIIAHMRETGEWGQLLPPSVSPFGYNETLASEYSPLSKEEALSYGFKWQDNMPGTKGKETFTVALPEAIKDTLDSITNEVLACADCKRNYRITTAELAFYKSKELPAPDLCPQCRYDKRRALRNPHSLWHRQCMCDSASHGHIGRCPIEFKTTYAPDRPEKVYCETCYHAEVV